MAIIKKRKATNADEDVDKEAPYLLLVKNASLCGRKGIRCRGSSWNGRQRYHMTQFSHSWASTWKSLSPYPRDVYTSMFTTIQSIQQETESAWPSVNRWMDKENGVCIGNEILFSHKEKLKYDMKRKIHKTGNHYAKRNIRLWITNRAYILYFLKFRLICTVVCIWMYLLVIELKKGA